MGNENMAARQRDTLFSAAEAAAPIELLTTIDEESESLHHVKLTQAYDDGTVSKLSLIHI